MQWAKFIFNLGISRVYVCDTFVVERRCDGCFCNPWEICPFSVVCLRVYTKAISHVHVSFRVTYIDEEEFDQQYLHFEATLKIFQLNSTSASGNEKTVKKFEELINFLSHVAPCFKKKGAKIPGQLLAILRQHYETLSPSLRKSITQGLIMLQNRNMISRLEILPTFFQLFRCKDKPLRALLFSHIVNDIKKVNQKSQNHRLNNTLQNFMFTMLNDENEMAARKSLDVMIELWRRKVWTDKKMVNAIVTACFSKDTKLKRGALQFMLGVAHYDENEEEEMEKNNQKITKDACRNKAMLVHTKRRGKKQRAIQRVMKKVKNSHNKLQQKVDVPAIQLVYDAQTFADRLFGSLRRSNDPFEVRLLMMNVISRLVGTHELLLENFYPFLQKYLQPHQRHVTVILSFLAQASHSLVPPDVLVPVIKTLANHFVTDRSSPEVMAVGLNAIREICARAPLAMDRDLLLDLTQYKKSKNKGIMMAGRSLIALFREINPTLLTKKDRGKETQMKLIAKGDGSHGNATGYDDDDERRMDQWARLNAATTVSGADLLKEAEEDEIEHDPTLDPWEMKEKEVDPEADSSDEEDIDYEALGLKEEREGEGDDDEMDGAMAADDDDDDVDSDAELLGSDDEGKEAKSALPYGATKIFTPLDFERIKALQQREAQAGRGQKRHREDGSTLQSKMSDIVDAEDIVGYVKKKKADREERLASILKGREGRDSFNKPKEKGGGTTNKQKLKTKPFMLTKHSKKVKYKLREKFSIKQLKQVKHIKHLKNQKDNKKKRK